MSDNRRRLDLPISTMMPLLSLLETRVLGVLVEKEHTVPDIYPLSLNALTAGCNQKNNRDPLLSASESEVQAAIDRLQSLSLVIESSGTRVMRYSQNVANVLRVPSEAVALLATLMLRGPQTAAELRIHSDRLHRFADISSVEGYLHELAARAAGPLAAELPRAPGARETRWVHLLSGVPPVVAAAPASLADAPLVAHSELVALRMEVGTLREEVAELKSIVAKLCAELGAAPT